MIDEPEASTIVGWFDPNGDLYAVFQRSTPDPQDLDDLDEDVEVLDPRRWYFVAADVSAIDKPFTWPDLLKEMEDFRGPVELISNGRLEHTS